MAKIKKKITVDILTLDYQLAELPSSQHRAGLAGLVLIERWLKRQPAFKEKEKNGAICDFIRLDMQGATLKINQAGLEALFDEIYAASLEEQESSTLWKKKNKEIVPPLREEEREEINSKIGKIKKKKVYIYQVAVPKGSFLADSSYDQSSDGNKGHWIKLWRDMVWDTVRKRPLTRLPFEERAKGNYKEDASKVWKKLSLPSDYTVDLPSTYFLGAQASNAENVPFKDRARSQFLLHFWIYAAQVYVPTVIKINKDGKDEREFIGYALAIPDVSNLKTFCQELPEVLRNRGTELSGYRPRECLVDLAVEGALDVMKRLRDRLAIRTGEQATSDLVLGVDVIHLNKEGDNVRLLGVSRLDPDYSMIDEHARIRKALWNPLFRKQRLLNLVNHKPWYIGFDALLSKLPDKQSIGNEYFRHDVRESFKYEVSAMSEEINNTSGDPLMKEPIDSSRSDIEDLIYKLVGIYINQKLDRKYQLKWSNVKDDPSKKDDYKKNKEKIAKSAFLDIRSRTEKMDFINYFASTLCSVPQYLKPEDFVTLTRTLYDETDKVRTLTLLALSANA